MKKRISLLSFILVFISCTQSDKTIDYVFNNFTNGAVLRTISSEGEFNFYTPDSSVFKATIEEHDSEDGGLMENVEIFVSLNLGKEVIIRTIQPSEFTSGPTGLPRTEIRVNLTEVVSALGLSKTQYTGGDAINIRLQLNLKDGRGFSSEGVTGSITGSYFNSPYRYNMIIKCIPLKAVSGIYLFNMADSYGDGWQGSHVKVTVDGTVKYFGIPSPYASDSYRNSILEPFNGNDSGGTAKLTIPKGASSMSFEWKSGDYPSECSYSINYTKLDGTGEQNAFIESSVSQGVKVLSICE